MSVGIKGEEAINRHLRFANDELLPTKSFNYSFLDRTFEGHKTDSQVSEIVGHFGGFCNFVPATVYLVLPLIQHNAVSKKIGVHVKFRFIRFNIVTLSKTLSNLLISIFRALLFSGYAGSLVEKKKKRFPPG
jgi:hypothetical protein